MWKDREGPLREDEFAGDDDDGFDGGVDCTDYRDSATMASDLMDEVYLLVQRLWYFALTCTGVLGAALLCFSACLAGVGEGRKTSPASLSDSLSIVHQAVLSSCPSPSPVFLPEFLQRAQDSPALASLLCFTG